MMIKQPYRKINSAWQLITNYWFNKHNFVVFSLLIVVLLMTIGIVGINVGMSYWHNNFYNALQSYNQQLVAKLLLVFCAIAGTGVVLSVYRYYLEQLITIKWRKWLTQQFIDLWLNKYNYYYLEKFHSTIDNPDQRIQEDIEIVINQSLELLIGLLESITTIGAFIYVLWSLSQIFNVTIGKITWHIHGYLVWVAMIYALLGSYATFKLGKPLIKLNSEQQKREANLRFAAIAIRNNSEAIALSNGEQYMAVNLKRSLNILLSNWRRIILRQKKLLWFNTSYNQVSIIIPVLLALPNYFSKNFLLGGLMQSCSAFNSIQTALSFFVNYYNNIATWRAALTRLLNLMQQLQIISDVNLQPKVLYKIGRSSELILKNIQIFTPDGKCLLKNCNFTFAAYTNYLIIGPSGLGKSTLVKVIAKIWPFATGEVILPEKQKILYLPQQPYFSSDTIRSALIFPEINISISESDIQALLRLCNLDKLNNLMSTSHNWAQILSPGELQRLNFVRLLIHKPNWVFLDESTSALDVTQERYLYNLVQESLPNLTIVSIGHNNSLVSLHQQTLDLRQFCL